MSRPSERSTTVSTTAGEQRASTHVVVLGAGYAGMITTNRFLGSLTDEERAAVHVTVVNPRPDFVERIRLHQLAAGSRDTVTRPLTSLLHPAAEVLVATATSIAVDRRTVVVESDEGPAELSWTHLVHAVGSGGAAPVPGAGEHAFAIGDLEGAQAALAAVTAAGDRPRVLVVGGGLTGIETASEFAEQHPHGTVTLVSATPVADGMRDAARSAITRRLRRLGVTVLETAVVELAAGRARLADGQVLPFDACLLATAFSVPDLAAASGLTVDAQGRLLVDEHLRSVDAPSVLGAGDAVVVAGRAGAHLRMSCSVALPMGGHAAAVLLSAVRGEPPAPFSMGFTAQCISLGRAHGYVQLVRADDSPRRLHLGGALGARVKEAVCRRVVDAPAEERTHPGAYTWRHGPLHPVA
jgi:NADH dehydrogenase FAD-containing subunit